jgi:hypothetical protein
MEDSLELASDFNMLNNIRISDFCHVAIIGTTYITFVPPAEGETKIACLRIVPAGESIWMFAIIDGAHGITTEREKYRR